MPVIIRRILWLLKQGPIYDLSGIFIAYEAAAQLLIGTYFY